MLVGEDKIRIDEIIDKHRGEKNALMMILSEAQKVFGCVSVELQKCIANNLNIPLAQVYGVATFNSQFSSEPKGKFVIGVCLGTACYVKGSQDIINEISKVLKLKIGKTSDDGKFTLVATRCIGACGLAPVLTVNDEVYGKVKVEDIYEILNKY